MSTQREAVCHPEFLEDLQHWIETDRRVARRLLDLMKAVLRDPFSGIGKPEPLKYLALGVWSRRITQEHPGAPRSNAACTSWRSSPPAPGDHRPAQDQRSRRPAGSRPQRDLHPPRLHRSLHRGSRLGAWPYVSVPLLEELWRRAARAQSSSSAQPRSVPAVPAALSRLLSLCFIILEKARISLRSHVQTNFS